VHLAVDPGALDQGGELVAGEGVVVDADQLVAGGGDQIGDQLLAAADRRIAGDASGKNRGGTRTNVPASHLERAVPVRLCIGGRGAPDRPAWP